MDITSKNFKELFGISYEEALQIIKEGCVSNKYYKACCTAQVLQAKEYLETNFDKQNITDSNNGFVFMTPSRSRKIIIK